MLAVPDPNVLVARECQLVPVEMVVRAYLTGTTSTSIWMHYEQGKREFCGHRLPDGLKKHQRLAAPILTPSTKAAHGDHDVSASREEILAISGMPAADFDRAAELAMALFRDGQRVCAERGLILVDTKYEFGKTPDGEIILIDEIHTPDSSRFWFQNTYEERFAAGQDPESFDKEYVRALPGRARLPRRRPHPGHPGRREDRGHAPLHRSRRAHHGRPLRAERRRAERAHGQEPAGGRLRALNPASAPLRFAVLPRCDSWAHGRKILRLGVRARICGI